jgi:hypothetical protein
MPPGAAADDDGPGASTTELRGNLEMDLLESSGMKLRPKQVWMGMYRKLPNGRNDWLKDVDGTRLKRPFGFKFLLGDVFNSDVASRHQLTRCIELGSTGTLEIIEGNWIAFVKELRTLASFVNELDDEISNVPMWDGRHIEQVTTYDAMIEEIIGFMEFAERHRGSNYTVSIASEQ